MNELMMDILNVDDFIFFAKKHMPNHTKHKFIIWYGIGSEFHIQFESYNENDMKFTNTVKIHKNEIIKYQRLKKIIKINDRNMQK
jgi:hypothetical protein